MPTCLLSLTQAFAPPHPSSQRSRRQIDASHRSILDRLALFIVWRCGRAGRFFPNLFQAFRLCSHHAGSGCLETRGGQSKLSLVWASEARCSTHRLCEHASQVGPFDRMVLGGDLCSGDGPCFSDLRVLSGCLERQMGKPLSSTSPVSACMAPAGYLMSSVVAWVAAESFLSRTGRGQHHRRRREDHQANN